ncbi:MAG: hypothetical protein FWD17_12890 [Polyangiaceae bacterium]|nr:hypothetical protein [Polyangiaceae bacterium]
MKRGLERGAARGLILFCAFVAWLGRFVQDDAFISFRYARHLAEGHGLVWNVGEPPFQGFTNPLWTLLLALGIRAGADPVVQTEALGLSCFVATLWATRRLAIELTGSPGAGLATAAALGLNFSFSSYATGGLETQSQAMFVTGVALAAARWHRRRAVVDAALASTCAGLALWTRLDSCVLVGPFLLHAAWSARRDRLAAAAVALPALLSALALFTFQWWNFESLLPNSFYAKTGPPVAKAVVHAAEYLASFMGNYSLFPLAALGVGLVPRAWRAAGHPWLVAAAAACGAWCGYLLLVGGDFMEYRMIVPAMPIAACLVGWAFARGAGATIVWAAAAGSVLGSASYAHRTSDQNFLTEGPAVETIHGLAGHLTDPQSSWVEVGVGLERIFGGDDRVTIAVMAAGAVPYYSRLRTIDMLGINDRWIPEHGVILGDRPGHRRGPTLAYLAGQRVTFVIHPWARRDPVESSLSAYGPEQIRRYVPQSDIRELPPDAEIVELPVAPDRPLRALYLVRNPYVDQMIRERGWRTFPCLPSVRDPTPPR